MYETYKPIKYSKRKDQSYGFMCIFNSYLWPSQTGAGS